MKHIQKIFPFILPSLFLARTVRAQEQAILSCTGTSCQFCDLFKTANNIISFGLQLLVALAVVYIIIAGFMMLTAGANPAQYKKARTMITQAIVGIAIAFSAWLLVDLFLKSIIGIDFQFDPWNEIQC